MHAPARTDETAAPADGDSIMVLLPVANLQEVAAAGGDGAPCLALCAERRPCETEASTAFPPLLSDPRRSSNPAMSNAVIMNSRWQPLASQCLCWWQTCEGWRLRAGMGLTKPAVLGEATADAFM